MTDSMENNDVKEAETKEKKNMGESVKGMAKSIGSKANLVVKKSSESLEKSKEAVFNAVDVNGDGQIDIEDVILMAFKVPGVSIKRDNFLRKELKNKYPEEVIEKAVDQTPMIACIKQKDIDKIADSIIQNERLKVSGISAALGAPGGAAMAATIPADIAQYY